MRLIKEAQKLLEACSEEIEFVRIFKFFRNYPISCDPDILTEERAVSEFHSFPNVKIVFNGERGVSYSAVYYTKEKEPLFSKEIISCAEDVNYTVIYEKAPEIVLNID
mgnify:CR=1 FL=1